MSVNELLFVSLYVNYWGAALLLNNLLVSAASLLRTLVRTHLSGNTGGTTSSTTVLLDSIVRYVIK